MSPDGPTTDDSGWRGTWAEHASAFDRVKSVTMTLTEARPAPWIAEEAAVSPNTARDHLQRLIDLGVVTATDTNGTRRYYPDPLYLWLRDVRDVLRDSSKQELSERAAELKHDVAAWKSEYDAETPEALRERAAAEGVSADRADEFVRIASDWELARYRLSLVQDAIENYDTWTSDPSSITV